MRYDAKRKLWVGWQIDVYVSRGAGKKPKRHRPTYPTESAARSAENHLKVKNENIKRGIEQPASDEKLITLREVFEKHLKIIEDKKKQQFEKRIFEYFLELLPAGIYINELTSIDIALYPESRSKDKTPQKTFVRPESINREMTVIAAALNLAPQRFKELRSYAPPRIRRPPMTGTRRERTLSDSEVVKILARLNRPQENESLKKYNERLLTALEIEFALLTSSRRKEVVKLKWTDYFPDQNLLLITRWKTLKTKDASVTVFSPVPRRVGEILRIRRPLAGEYVFSANGKENYYRYIRDLKEACQFLKIPYGRFTEGGLILHDARHTFVSNLIKNKVDLETARELAGLSRETILRYAHSSPAQKRHAVGIIDKNQTDLRSVYDKVRKGELDFEEFCAFFDGHN